MNSYAVYLEIFERLKYQEDLESFRFSHFSMLQHDLLTPSLFSFILLIKNFLQVLNETNHITKAMGTLPNRVDKKVSKIFNKNLL